MACDYHLINRLTLAPVAGRQPRNPAKVRVTGRIASQAVTGDWSGTGIPRFARKDNSENTPLEAGRTVRKKPWTLREAVITYMPMYLHTHVLI
jgi:hypothetical protein